MLRFQNFQLPARRRGGKREGLLTGKPSSRNLFSLFLHVSNALDEASNYSKEPINLDLEVMMLAAGGVSLRDNGGLMNSIGAG